MLDRGVDECCRLLALMDDPLRAIMLYEPKHKAVRRLALLRF